MVCEEFTHSLKQSKINKNKKLRCALITTTWIIKRSARETAVIPATLTPISPTHTDSPITEHIGARLDCFGFRVSPKVRRFSVFGFVLVQVFGFRHFDSRSSFLGILDPHVWYRSHELLVILGEVQA